MTKVTCSQMTDGNDSNTSIVKHVAKKLKAEQDVSPVCNERDTGIAEICETSSGAAMLPNQSTDYNEPSDLIKAIMIQATRMGDINRPQLFRTFSDDAKLTPEPIPLSETDLPPRKNKSKKNKKHKASQQCDEQKTS